VNQELQDKLEALDVAVLRPIQDCEASCAEDKTRILDAISKTVGLDRFNYQVSVLLQMQGPGVSGFGAWRAWQDPAPWQDLVDRFHNTLSAEERRLWRLREVAAFDREKWVAALQNPSRFEYRYLPHDALRCRRVVGVPAAWEDLKAKLSAPGPGPKEFDGDILPGMAVYETVGPGPKLFAVVDGRVYYHDFGKWQQHLLGTQEITAGARGPLLHPAVEASPSDVDVCCLC